MNFKINLIVFIIYFINLSKGQNVFGKFEIKLNFSDKNQIQKITKKSISFSNQLSNDVLNPPLCGIGHLPRITGGEKADPRQFPWTVAIIDNKRKMVFCGGSAISQQFILTAAHCIKNHHNFNQSNITIRLGAHKISPGSAPEPESRDFAVRNWKIHEQYEDQEYSIDQAPIEN